MAKKPESIDYFFMSHTMTKPPVTLNTKSQNNIGTKGQQKGVTEDSDSAKPKPAMIIDRGVLFMKRLEEEGALILMRDSHRATLNAFETEDNT